MKHRVFGPTGQNVSIIGMGTWKIDGDNRKQAVATLGAGLDLGMNHIDTAEMYGDAELIVAEAIKGRRDEAFLVSKVLPHNASRSGTRAACEQSLKRLGTDRLDCYLLHWRGRYPLEETIGAFADLEREGKIRSWGVSNFDEEDMEDAERIAAGLSTNIACNQVLYHLKERAIEHSVLPWCARQGVAVTAYSPFGQDDFPSAGSSGGRALKAISDAHGATPRQVALAFLIRDPAVFAIPKTANPKHVAENAAAEVTLSAEDVARLDEAFPKGRKPRSLPML